MTNIVPRRPSSLNVRSTSLATQSDGPSSIGLNVGSRSDDEVTPEDLFLTVTTLLRTGPAPRGPLVNERQDGRSGGRSFTDATLSAGDPTVGAGRLATLAGVSCARSWESHDYHAARATDYWLTGNGSVALPDGYAILGARSVLVPRDVMRRLEDRDDLTLFGLAATTAPKWFTRQQEVKTHTKIVAAANETSAMNYWRRLLTPPSGHVVTSMGAHAISRYSCEFTLSRQPAVWDAGGQSEPSQGLPTLYGE